MRVLFAVDGSEGSFAAVRQVAPLLRADRDHIGIYYRPPEIEPRGGSVDGGAMDAARRAIADSITAAAGKQLPTGFASTPETIVGHQDPRRGLLLAAEQWKADLVAMGARGLGRLERMLLGSVSRAVVQAAGVPVWVARPRKDAAPTALRVLVAAKGAHAAEDPVQLLSRLSWPEGSSFTLLSVLQSLFAGRVPDWLQHQARSPDVEEMARMWAQEHEQEARDRLAELKQFAQRLQPPLAGANAEVMEGDPTTLILNTIARDRVDLAVVGSRTKRPLIGSFLGSTATAVLDHAECSVLIVPHRENP